MKKPRLSIKNLRYLKFLAFNVCLLLFLYCTIIRPIRTLFAEKAEEIARQTELLTRYKSISAKKDNLVSFTLASNSSASRSDFLDGANEGEMGAQLQTLVKTIIETNKSHLNSARPLPNKTALNTKFLGAHFEMVASISKLQATLFAIENNRPALFAATTLIRVAGLLRQQTINEEPRLEAELEIYGVKREQGK